jgi:hypothetical protein
MRIVEGEGLIYETYLDEWIGLEYDREFRYYLLERCANGDGEYSMYLGYMDEYLDGADDYVEWLRGVLGVGDKREIYIYDRVRSINRGINVYIISGGYTVRIYR